MNNQFIFVISSLAFFVCLMACSSNKQNELIENNLVSKTDSIKKQEQKTREETSIFRERLRTYLNSSINLTEMKNEIGFLSMGWSISSDYLPSLPEGQRQYNYGAVGGLILDPSIRISPKPIELKQSGEKFLSIITYKPWTTAKEKYYTTDNETIIGFETNVNYELLDSLNFVGLDIDSIQSQFGEPDTIIENSWLYKEDRKVLSLHVNDGFVDWMKFYELNDSIFSMDHYPKELHTWTAK